MTDKTEPDGAAGARVPTFADLWRNATWQPIPNCPGRYKLVSTGSVPLAALLGDAARIEQHRVEHARDLVLVARLIDGGVISYRRTNGNYLHTLNTVLGFARKLDQLGIAQRDCAG